MNEYVSFYYEIPESQQQRKKDPSKRPVVELCSIQKLYPGQKLFVWEMATKKISLFSFSQDRKMVFAEPGFMYVIAINEKVAHVKFLKMLERASDAFNALGSSVIDE